jgi:hypothetical protein
LLRAVLIDGNQHLIGKSGLPGVAAWRGSSGGRYRRYGRSRR